MSCSPSSAAPAGVPPWPEFVCPSCHAELEHSPSEVGEAGEAYHCAACQRAYPVLHGIPDFRLRSDEYLSLEEEREKAQRLAEHECEDFAALLDYYYEITEDVSVELAQRYKAYNHNGPQLAHYGLERLGLQAGQSFLDAGCGSGGALLAASQLVEHPVGVDLALRWLVICKRRLEQQGVAARLVCADVEALPFRPGSFDRVLASDLLENVRDVPGSLAALEQAMAPGAALWLTGGNKYSLGPHPSTRIWALGYLPRALRSALLLRLRGVDSLRFTQLISPLAMRSLGKRLGLDCAHMGPKQLPKLDTTAYPAGDRGLIRLYRWLCRLPVVSSLLLFVGPAFEMLLHKPPSKEK